MGNGSQNKQKELQKKLSSSEPNRANGKVAEVKSGPPDKSGFHLDFGRSLIKRHGFFRHPADPHRKDIEGFHKFWSSNLGGKHLLKDLKPLSGTKKK